MFFTDSVDFATFGPNYNSDLLFLFLFYKNVAEMAQF